MLNHIMQSYFVTNEYKCRVFPNKKSRNFAFLYLLHVSSPYFDMVIS